MLFREISQVTKPAIFTELSFDAAIATSKADGTLLLVYATAGWCTPGQVMDRTTWSDPKLVKGLMHKVMVIYVDLDAAHDLSAQLHVRAMPTIIAFKDGREIDRLTGLQKTSMLLEWIDGLSHGETALDKLRAEAAANLTNIDVRLQLARKLVSAGHYDDATAEYIWLWQHMLEHNPAFYGVRHSFLVSDLQELIQKHPPARAAFAALRQACAPRDLLDAETLRDWFSLNEALGEAKATVVWFDQAKPTGNVSNAFSRVLETTLVPLLIAVNRWADAGKLYADPMMTFRRKVEILHYEPPNQELMDFLTSKLRDEAAEIVRALHAAGRTDEAHAVRDEARRVDPSREMEAALKRVEPN
jgi:hypothetical protein